MSCGDSDQPPAPRDETLTRPRNRNSVLHGPKSSPDFPKRLVSKAATLTVIHARSCSGERAHYSTRSPYSHKITANLKTTRYTSICGCTCEITVPRVHRGDSARTLADHTPHASAPQHNKIGASTRGAFCRDRCAAPGGTRGLLWLKNVRAE